MDPVLLTKAHLPTHLLDVISDKSDGIWCLGNMELLRSRALSFCGSRKASVKGMTRARQCAQQATKHGLACVSGNAAGIDEVIHGTSLEHGGYTILVLPEGIDNFRIRKSLQHYWDWDHCLVISQFERNARWQVWRAMERNKLIISLGLAMIVIEASEKGGTQEAARQTVELGKPLFVAKYAEPITGNEIIIDRGANKLGLDKITKVPNIKKVVELSLAQSEATKKGQMNLPLI